MNKVITIGREFGSGGRELGRRLAEELGYDYYDKEIITEIVRHTEYSEDYVKHVVEGKRHMLFPISIEQSLNPTYDEYIMDMRDILGAQSEVIREMATKSDCIIVGRCADYILNDNPDIDLFRVFVYSDLESKIKRTLGRAHEGEHLTEKEVTKQVKRINKERAAYYGECTLQKWGDKENYDFMINTTALEVEKLVPSIASLFR